MNQRNKNLPANAPPRVGDTLAMLRQAGSLSLDELSRKAGVSKLKIQEMGSRYLFIVLYVLIEKLLSRGDYRRRR